MREARGRRPARSVVALALALALGASLPARLAFADEPARPTPPPAYEEPPNQLAWVSLVSGGVCLATGIGFGVAAVVEQRNARDIEQGESDDQARSAPAAASYQDAIDTRDDLRVVSGIAGGTGLGLFLLAGILFARDDISREAAKPPAVVSVSAHPIVGPGVAGASATMSF